MRDDLSPRQIIDEALRQQKKRRKAERRHEAKSRKDVIAEARSNVIRLKQETAELLAKIEEIKARQERINAAMGTKLDKRQISDVLPM